jgi:hypothetical protein
LKLRANPRAVIMSSFVMAGAWQIPLTLVKLD